MTSVMCGINTVGYLKALPLDGSAQGYTLYLTGLHPVLTYIALSGLLGIP